MEVQGIDLGTLLAAMSIPSVIFSAIVGFCFWWFEKKLERREKEHDKKDAARRQNEVIMIESMNAAIALGEATARAVQRIPDAHCNGDMHAALEYASSIKHKHRNFITEQGIDSLY